MAHSKAVFINGSITQKTAAVASTVAPVAAAATTKVATAEAAATATATVATAQAAASLGVL